MHSCRLSPDKYPTGTYDTSSRVGLSGHQWDTGAAGAEGQPRIILMGRRLEWGILAVVVVCCFATHAAAQGELHGSAGLQQ